MENRILYECGHCGVPTLEKVGFKIYLLANYKGGRFKHEIERDMTTPYGQMTVTCGACGIGKHHFVHFSEVVHAEDKFTAKVNKQGLTSSDSV